MRPATLIILAIMLVAFVALTWMANTSLDLVRQDIETAQQLTARFLDLGQLAPGAPIKLRKAPSHSEYAGAGLFVELTPAAALLVAPGRIEGLARQVAAEALETYPRASATSLGWVQVRVHLPEAHERVAGMLVDEEGRLGRPKPALPLTWPERSTAPAPAPAAAPAPAPEAPAPGPEAPAPAMAR